MSISVQNTGIAATITENWFLDTRTTYQATAKEWTGYTLAIDWLSLYCTCDHTDLKEGVGVAPIEGMPKLMAREFPHIAGYTYDLQEYGTRQYKQLWFVYVNKEKVAEVQCIPHSGILESNSVIVKFDNRLLYHAQFWGTVHNFLRQHELNVQRITRLDIAADFNKFYCYQCVPFIRDFLSTKLRHVGRGHGQSNFAHGAKTDEVTKHSIAWLNYDTLSFGSRSSDVRVYLYNKTRELAEVHDKPYIRDTWKTAGLVSDSQNNVWRLEVSIKGKGIRYKNKDTDQEEEITLARIQDDGELLMLYNTFVEAYFSFVHNHDGITNITREPRLKLFGEGLPKISRGYLRCVTGANRADKIFIKKMITLSDELRAMDTLRDHIDTEAMAYKVARATDLKEWLDVKRPEWEKINHKQ